MCKNNLFLYAFKVTVLYSVTFEVLGLSVDINNESKYNQNKLRLPRNLPDDLKGVSDDELWNLLTKRDEKDKNDNDINNEVPEDYDFGSLFDSDDEGDTTVDSLDEITIISDYDNLQTTLPTRPAITTTGFTATEDDETTTPSTQNPVNITPSVTKSSEENITTTTITSTTKPRSIMTTSTPGTFVSITTSTIFSETDTITAATPSTTSTVSPETTTAKPVTTTKASTLTTTQESIITKPQPTETTTATTITTVPPEVTTTKPGTTTKSSTLTTRQELIITEPQSSETTMTTTTTTVPPDTTALEPSKTTSSPTTTTQESITTETTRPTTNTTVPPDRTTTKPGTTTTLTTHTTLSSTLTTTQESFRTKPQPTETTMITTTTTVPPEVTTTKPGTTTKSSTLTTTQESIITEPQPTETTTATTATTVPPEVTTTIPGTTSKSSTLTTTQESVSTEPPQIETTTATTITTVPPEVTTTKPGTTTKSSALTTTQESVTTEPPQTETTTSTTTTIVPPEVTTTKPGTTTKFSALTNTQESITTEPPQNETTTFTTITTVPPGTTTSEQSIATTSPTTTTQESITTKPQLNVTTTTKPVTTATRSIITSTKPIKTTTRSPTASTKPITTRRRTTTTTKPTTTMRLTTTSPKPIKTTTLSLSTTKPVTTTTHTTITAKPITTTTRLTTTTSKSIKTTTCSPTTTKPTTTTRLTTTSPKRIKTTTLSLSTTKPVTATTQITITAKPITTTTRLTTTKTKSIKTTTRSPTTTKPVITTTRTTTIKPTKTTTRSTTTTKPVITTTRTTTIKPTKTTIRSTTTTKPVTTTTRTFTTTKPTKTTTRSPTTTTKPITITTRATATEKTTTTTTRLTTTSTKPFKIFSPTTMKAVTITTRKTTTTKPIITKHSTTMPKPVTTISRSTSTSTKPIKTTVPSTRTTAKPITKISATKGFMKTTTSIPPYKTTSSSATVSYTKMFKPPSSREQTTKSPDVGKTYPKTKCLKTTTSSPKKLIPYEVIIPSTTLSPKVFGNVFDPKAKFDIPENDVKEKTETTEPSFRPVDNRHYPVTSGQRLPQVHQTQRELIPFCYHTGIGPTGLQCYYVERNVPISVHPRNPPPPYVQPHRHVNNHHYVSVYRSATTRRPPTFLSQPSIKPNVINAQVPRPWIPNNPSVKLEIRNSHFNVSQVRSQNPSMFVFQGQNRQALTSHNPFRNVLFIRQGQLPQQIPPSNYPHLSYNTYQRHKRSFISQKDYDSTKLSDKEIYLNDEVEENTEEEDGITLAFVFDTTGSMGPELQQVKQQATKIANSMLDNTDRPIYDYVFVPFHDERRPSPPIRTRDHNQFLSVINKIKVKNGGDCPEKCLGGVLKAINMSRPYSPIYVFTDAYAKDYYLEEDIIFLIQRKHPQIFFLTTGYCDEDHDLFDVYRRIAATSSGHVFQTSKKDIEEVLKYVRGSLKKGKVLLTSVNSNVPARVPHDIPISVDKSLKEFTVTASGENTKINVLNPQGNLPDPKQIRPVLNLHNVQVINVQEPEPGVWTVKVKSNSPYSVVSTGLSTINFVYGFSILKTGNIGETSKRPLKSAGNYLVIKATDPTNLKNVTEVKIINLKGRVLDIIPMKEISSEKGLFSGGPHVPPDEYFKLEINGLGCDGLGVKRVTTAAISPQLPEKPYITLKDKVIIKAGRPYNLTCSIESLVPVSVRLFRNGQRVSPRYYNQTTDMVLVFDKISKNDEGIYLCWAKNVAGIEVKETQIKVIAVPPEIKVNDIIVTRSGEVTKIPCIVESMTEYKVTWYKSKTSRDNFYRNNIIPLINPTYEESTLVIPKAEISDEGWYICVASNDAGEGRGETYLTVQELPAILTADSVVFQKGNNISLECYIIKGNPVPKLIWYKNNHQLHETSYKRLEKTNTSLFLVLYSADKVDEGTYKCDAVSPIGKATRDVKVTYQEPPKIIGTSRDIKIKSGEDIVLECLATGYPSPEINWDKNGTLITPQENSNMETSDHKLIIKQIKLSDSGNYTCTAKNDVGKDKDIITVTVGMPPQILNRDTDKDIEIGKYGRIYCIAAGQPKPTISWKYNNSYLDDTNVDNNYVIIKEAGLKDAGIYQCDAENIFGKAHHRISVRVTGAVPPIIKKTGTPEVIKHVTGDRVELSCPVIQGRPKPNITWYMNNNKIDNAHVNGFNLNRDSVIINQVTARYIGEYECIAENPLGVDKKQVHLKLYEPPKIDKNTPVNVEVLEGKNVTLICNVSGDPIPLVIWSRLSGPYNFIMRGHKEDGSNNLFFTEVTAEDIGKYVCRAKNIAGIAKQDYALNVIVPPKIVKWPPQMEVEVGNMVSLHCNVYSLPKATVRWLRNNNTLYKPNAIYGPYLRFYATSSDGGKYSCEAENKAGTDRADVNLIILESPSIKSIPPKVEVLKGEDLIVQCIGTGTPEPEVIWYYQGKSIDHQKTSNKSNILHIENVTESQNGFYTCVATNKLGNSRKTTEVKVLIPPVVKSWDSIFKVIPGEEVVINCEVTGVPVPYITWYKDGEPLEKEYLASEGKLKFVAKDHHSGEYSCRAVNKVGKDSKSLTLIVLEPPVFARYLPNSLDILLEENADLPCVAFGDPKPIITWNKIHDPQQLHETKFISYENGTLKIINVTIQDDGFYKCAAQNKAGMVTREIKLNVLEKPQAKLYANSTIVHEGNDIILTCEIKGRPKPKIIWMKEGNVLLYPTNNNTFRLTATAGDSGVYTCLAENIVGKDEDNINITIYVAPVISGPKEESIIGLKGEDITLKCQLQGIPKPSLTWIRNNTEVLYTRDHYRLLNNSLLMQNLTLMMAGIYICETKNPVGTSRKTFKINVHARPEILNNLETNVTLNEGDNYHFTCTVTGIPTPLVQWQKDGTSFFSGFNNGEILVIENNTLVLANVRSDMSGMYYCIASNIHGEITKNYSVLVIEPSRVFRPDIHHVEINASDTGTLSCPLNESLPVKVIWLRDEKPIGSIMHERADDVHFSITSGKELKITEAFPEDTGNYTCIGIYPTMNVSSDFLVDVLIRPQFIDEYPPDEYIVKEGDDLKIDCRVSGHPPPRVNWKYLDKNLPITETTVPGVHFEGNNKEFLTILSMKINQSGKYTCTAVNKLGKEKRDFRIIVTD